MKIQKYTEERPWGSFTRFTHNEPSTVKIITIKVGEELSLQYHAKRTEFWRILAGVAECTVGDSVQILKVGEEIEVSAGQKHRIKALNADSGEGRGVEDVQVLEIALGEFDEKDIVRLEDKYKRANLG